MREKAISFGGRNSLIGIFTNATRTEGVSRPGVIMLNSGILHRTGASRLHVTLARILAAAGYPVMRFDFSGIGDSEPRRDELSFEESAPREVQDAMDRMESLTGCHEFVIFGLCSGADVAFMVGPTDRRVVGVIQLDAPAYRNWKWYLHHYGPRALKLGVWTHFFQRKVVAPIASRNQDEEEGLDMDTHALPTYVREYPSQQEFAKSLQALADRRVQQLFVFTSSALKNLNYSGQFEDTFADVSFGDTLQVELWPDADHIFRGPAPQRRLYKVVTEWMAKHWPVPAVSGEDASASQKVA